MSIDDIIRCRRINEILHFTTNSGLLGILDSQSLKARKRLENEKRLEHILQLNTPEVRDLGWEDYVNLSISRINNSLFGLSSGLWHNESEIWWCILAFSPSIITHEGVYFSTVNNIWPRNIRGLGENALERLFSPSVIGRYDSVIERPTNMPDSYTTCDQAELLYPSEIPTNFLSHIYVATTEDQDDARGQIHIVNHPEVEVVVNPSMFGMNGG